MYAEALKSGVMLHSFADLQLEDRAEMTIPPDSPLLSKYAAYLDHLPRGGSSLESLIQAHRTLQLQWRGAITRAGQDTRVLGALHRQVDPALCEAVPARNNHRTCSPTSWKYELPRRPDEQAKQLLSEHRRLVRQMPMIREPVDRQGEMAFSRPRTDYENLIVQAWDATTPLPAELEMFMAEHVHDSVAHFTDWPCALHEQRGIFCDRDRYLAKSNQKTAALVA